LLVSLLKRKDLKKLSKIKLSFILFCGVNESTLLLLIAFY